MAGTDVLKPFRSNSFPLTLEYYKNNHRGDLGTDKAAPGFPGGRTRGPGRGHVCSQLVPPRTPELGLDGGSEQSPSRSPMVGADLCVSMHQGPAQEWWWAVLLRQVVTVRF